MLNTIELHIVTVHLAHDVHANVAPNLSCKLHLVNVFFFVSNRHVFQDMHKKKSMVRSISGAWTHGSWTTHICRKFYMGGERCGKEELQQNKKELSLTMSTRWCSLIPPLRKNDQIVAPFTYYANFQANHIHLYV